MSGGKKSGPLRNCTLEYMPAARYFWLLLVFATGNRFGGETIVTRAGALLLTLTVGGAAHASCFLDEKAANTATQVVTYLNACLDQPSLGDEGMLEVFFKLGAAVPNTDGRQCRQAIILRAAAAGGKLRNSPRQTGNPSAPH